MRPGVPVQDPKQHGRPHPDRAVAVLQLRRVRQGLGPDHLRRLHRQLMPQLLAQQPAVQPGLQGAALILRVQDAPGGVGILHHRHADHLRHEALQAHPRLRRHRPVLQGRVQRGEHRRDLRALLLIAVLQLDEAGEGQGKRGAAELQVHGLIEQAELHLALAHRLAAAELPVGDAALGVGVDDPVGLRLSGVQGQGVAQQQVLPGEFHRQPHGIVGALELHPPVRLPRGIAALRRRLPGLQHDAKPRPHSRLAGIEHPPLHAAHPHRHGALARAGRGPPQAEGQIGRELPGRVLPGGHVGQARLDVPRQTDRVPLALPAPQHGAGIAVHDALHIRHGVRHDGLAALLVQDGLIQHAAQIGDLHLLKFQFHRITPCRFYHNDMPRAVE